MTVINNVKSVANRNITIFFGKQANLVNKNPVMGPKNAANIINKVL